MSDEIVGADPTVGEPAQPEPAEASGQPEHDKGDLEARLRNEPDFAVTEYKKLQSELTRQQQRAAKFKTLEPVVDMLGSTEAIVQHLNRWGNVYGNQQIRNMIEQWERTGRVPEPPSRAREREDWSDEDVPSEPVVDANALRIQALERELAELRGERGEERLKTHLKSFFDKFPLSDSEKETVLTGLEAQAKVWASNDSGRALLKNLNYDTVRSLALSKLDDDTLERMAERRLKQKGMQKLAAATDEPPSVRTNGREQPQFEKGVEGTVRAIRAIRKELGLSPDSPLI